MRPLEKKSTEKDEQQQHTGNTKPTSSVSRLEVRYCQYPDAPPPPRGGPFLPLRPSLDSCAGKTNWRGFGLYKNWLFAGCLPLEPNRAAADGSFCCRNASISANQGNERGKVSHKPHSNHDQCVYSLLTQQTNCCLSGDSILSPRDFRSGLRFSLVQLRVILRSFWILGRIAGSCDPLLPPSRVLRPHFLTPNPPITLSADVSSLFLQNFVLPIVVCLFAFLLKEQASSSHMDCCSSTQTTTKKRCRRPSQARRSLRLHTTAWSVVGERQRFPNSLARERKSHEADLWLPPLHQNLLPRPLGPHGLKWTTEYLR